LERVQAVDQVQALVRGPAKESSQRQHWPDTATAQAEALHRLLTINDRQWHDLKGQPCRRAAEQLAGALVQLLAGDGPNAGLASDGRQRAIALTRSALAWLEGELKDPGCPSHGR
jgi:predicted lipoprotein